MRDPDLVQRAEQAAAALEQAWMRWRERHGLGSGRLPPVSSYVGYSVEEPWGQPRVVLGVEASEAERLAAMLDGHDCAGSGRAEPAGLPEHRRPAGLDPAPARTIPDGRLPVEVEPTPQVASQAGSLILPPAQSRPAIPPTPAPLAAGATASAEMPGRADGGLKDLAARVTTVHHRADVQGLPQPEPTQSALADGSEPVSGQPLAADSGRRTQALPVSRPRMANGEPVTSTWPVADSRQPAADTAV
jgi:hypothetical protein